MTVKREPGCQLYSRSRQQTVQNGSERRGDPRGAPPRKELRGDTLPCRGGYGIGAGYIENKEK